MKAIGLTGINVWLTATIIDAQSVKKQRDQANNVVLMWKKIKEVERHISVDTMGNLLIVCVHSVNIQERGAQLLIILENNDDER